MDTINKVYCQHFSPNLWEKCSVLLISCYELILFRSLIVASSIKLGNAGLIHDQRYRTDPDAGMPMPMPDWGNWEQEIMPAFQHLHMIFQCHIERVHPFLPPALWTCRVYSYPPPTGWARIFKRVWGPGIDSKEWIPPAYVAWWAGTIILFLFDS